MWVEKYEFGLLFDDKINSILTQVEDSGSIIFGTQNGKIAETKKHSLLG